MPPKSTRETREGVGWRSSETIEGTLICAAKAKRNVGSELSVCDASRSGTTLGSARAGHAPIIAPIVRPLPLAAPIATPLRLGASAEWSAATHGSVLGARPTAYTSTVMMIAPTHTTTNVEADPNDSSRRRKASGPTIGTAARIQSSREALCPWAGSAPPPPTIHRAISGSMSPTTMR